MSTPREEALPPWKSGSSRLATPTPRRQLTLSKQQERAVSLAKCARLYVVRQRGPNAFLVRGDMLFPKYAVMLGEQSCSCGYRANSGALPCVHLLFMMIRVLQVRPTDPIVWSSVVRDFEVESLVTKYQQRLRSRLISAVGRGQQGGVKRRPIDGDDCPICLMPLSDGESLSWCRAGCGNNVHAACIKIWAEERIESEPLTCPLCRVEWHFKPLQKTSTPSTPTSSSSPVAGTMVSIDGMNAGGGGGGNSGIFGTAAASSSSSSRGDSEQRSSSTGKRRGSSIGPVTNRSERGGGGGGGGGSLGGGGGGGEEDLLQISSTSINNNSSQRDRSLYSERAPVAAAASRPRTSAGSSSSSITSSSSAAAKANQRQLSAEPIPLTKAEEARPFVAIFGEPFARCLFSSYWELRLSAVTKLEIALHQQPPSNRNCLDGDSNNDSITIKDLAKPSCLETVFLVVNRALGEQLRNVVNAGMTLFVTAMSAAGTAGVDPRRILSSCKPTVSLLVKLAATDKHNPAAIAAVTELVTQQGAVGRVAILHSLLPSSVNGSNNANTITPATAASLMANISKASSSAAAAAASNGESEDLESSGEQSKRLLAATAAAAASAAAAATVGSLEETSGQTSSRLSQTAQVILSSPVKSTNSSSSRLASSAPPDLAAEVASGAGAGGAAIGRNNSGSTSNNNNNPPAASAAAAGGAAAAPAAGSAATANKPFSSAVSTATRKQEGLGKLRLLAATVPLMPSEFESEARLLYLINLAHTKMCEGALGSRDTDTAADIIVSMYRIAGGRVAEVLSSLPLRTTQRQHLEGLFHEIDIERMIGVSSGRSVSSNNGGGGSNSGAPSRADSGKSLNGGNNNNNGNNNNHNGSSSPSSLITDNSISTGGSSAFSPIQQQQQQEQNFASRRALGPVVESPMNSPGNNNGGSSTSTPASRNHSRSPIFNTNGNGRSRNGSPIFDGIVISRDASSDAAAAAAGISSPGAGNSSVANDENNDDDYYRPPSPPNVNGRWQRGQILGRGASGTVYSAMDSEGRLFAVKEVAVGELEVSNVNNTNSNNNNGAAAAGGIGFALGGGGGPKKESPLVAVEREIAVMATLRHPNVVSYYGCAREGGVMRLFLELVDGGSIATMLSKFGKFNSSVIRSYTIQILSGLTYLHNNAVIHSDIKGANTLIDARGTVRLADFGTCLRLKNTFTQSGEFRALRGTPQWMAPEVIQGKGYGRKSDIWSLGCTVIEMATAAAPWTAANLTNDFAVLFSIGCGKKAPPIPDDLPQDAKDFLRDCFKRGEKERPSAAALSNHKWLRPANVETPVEIDSDKGLGQESLDSMISDASTTTASPPPPYPNPLPTTSSSTPIIGSISPVPIMPSPVAKFSPSASTSSPAPAPALYDFVVFQKDTGESIEEDEQGEEIEEVEVDRDVAATNDEQK